MATFTDKMNERAVTIAPTGLAGDLVVPANASGIVVFAHGSGSSRKSSRNRFVARVLQQAGFATLLMDLLTEREEEVDRQTAHLRFDIPLLASRLQQATDWLAGERSTSSLGIGYFGASTGAAAALMAASAQPDRVASVVSRGGRPDLAEGALPHVQAPTLLMVGSLDEPVIEMNRWAYARMDCEKRLEIVPGASHLFEEPGTLEQVAALAADWFRRTMRGDRQIQR